MLQHIRMLHFNDIGLNTRQISDCLNKRYTVNCLLLQNPLSFFSDILLLQIRNRRHSCMNVGNGNQNVVFDGGNSTNQANN